MISPQELQQLRDFRTDVPEAITLYFQPPAPSELAHRREPILLKEKIQQALGDLQAGSADMRSDLNRLLDLAANLQGNSGKTKIVFACSRQNIWREYDLPGDFGLAFEVGNTFSLAPLAVQANRPTRYCIALADRNRARLLLLEAGDISEHSQVLDEEKEKIRTTGARNSRSAERQKEEPVRLHFQFLAEHLLHFHEHGDYDRLLIGCRDEMWSEIEGTLHTDLKRILLGHFRVDPGLATQEEILERVQPLIAEREQQDEEKLVETVEGESRRNGLGAVGLAAVIDSLEKGEVQTLLWSAQSQSRHQSASLCSQCGLIALGIRETCDSCGGKTWQFDRAEEALLRHPQTRGIEMRALRTAKLPPPDGIAALLRFRADRSTAQALAS